MRVTAVVALVFSSIAATQIPAAAAPQTSVAGWGYNGVGTLGIGTITDSLGAKLIPRMSNVNTVSAGGLHSLILNDDGTVSATGYNALGALGDGTMVDAQTPVSVEGLTDAVQVSAGALHSLAVKSDGTVWSWGYNGLGQLGTGNTTDQNVPVKVNGLTDVVSVSAGFYHNLALKNDGTVWGWGYNGVGTLGDGTTVDRLEPTEVPGLAGVQQVSAGTLHSLALNNAGEVMAWGYNGFGQLGNGTKTDSTVPVAVQSLGGPATMVSAGGYHSLATRSTGGIRSWGFNGFGQLGNGGTGDRSLPVTVPSLGSPDQISAGYVHNLARKGGNAYSWGWNGFGQLGTDSRTDRLLPVLVKNLTNVSFVSSGLLHSLAAGRFDTAKPVLKLPATITKEAPGAAGLLVEYTASATDAVDGPVDVNCAPPSGATFELGDTNVDCSAADSQGNTATGQFKVTVQDTTRPVLDLPADITKTAELGETSAVVEYTATATDSVDGPVDVSCNPPSGSRFPVGNTTVNCSATDAAGNTSTGSFTVTVSLL